MHIYTMCIDGYGSQRTFAGAPGSTRPIFFRPAAALPREPRHRWVDLAIGFFSHHLLVILQGGAP